MEETLSFKYKVVGGLWTTAKFGKNSAGRELSPLLHGKRAENFETTEDFFAGRESKISWFRG